MTKYLKYFLLFLLLSINYHEVRSRCDVAQFAQLIGKTLENSYCVGGLIMNAEECKITIKRDYYLCFAIPVIYFAGFVGVVSVSCAINSVLCISILKKIPDYMDEIIHKYTKKNLELIYK